MAKVYLDAGDNFALSGAASVYGSTGAEKVTINTGVTGVVVDANVERVDLSGASSTYTFQQAGNQLKVFSGTTLVATIPLQDDANGTQLVFSNGSVEAKVGATGMTLGGAVVPSAAAAAVTPTTIDATVTTGSGVATGGTTTGQAFTLTNSATADAFALTTGNDTVTGASGTFADGDTVTDGTTTDNDTLTAQVTTAVVKPVLTNVENVNINGDFVTTGLDLTSVTGTKVATFNTGITSGTATVGLTTGTAGAKTTATQKIVFGNNIATATINADATGTAGTVNVDSGSISNTLTFAGASAADNYALTFNGNLKLAGVNTVETLKATSSVANGKITFQEVYTAGKTLDIAGTNNVILAGSAANLDGRVTSKSSTGTVTVDITGAGAVDTTKMAGVSAVILDAPAGAVSITVNSGVAVSTGIDQGNAAFTIAAPVATATTNAVTFNNSAANQTGLVGSSVKTLTVNSAAPLVNGVDATYAVLDNGTDNVVLTGTNDVKVTAGKAKSVDASTLVGALTYTQSTAVTTTVKGGSGANVVTLLANTVDSTYVGQNGGDSVTLATTTASASVTTGSGNDTITANTITTGSASINTGAGDDTVSATGLTTGVISTNLGDGNDTFTVGAGATTTGTVVLAVDGGAGTDSLLIAAAADFSGGTFSVTSVETVKVTGGGTLTFSAAQMSGKTQAFAGTSNAADQIIVKGVAGTTSIDLSGITSNTTVGSAVGDGTIQAVAIDATASTAAVTIKGTAQTDVVTISANGSTFYGGAGKDKITLAGGADKVAYTATTAAALATEAGTSTSGVGTTLATGTGDTIVTFVVGTDKIVLSTAFASALGASYTTASTSLSAADFISGAIGTATITADTANGGRFIFDTTAKTLYFDTQGNTTADGAGNYTGCADDFVVATTTGVSLTASDFAFM